MSSTTNWPIVAAAASAGAVLGAVAAYAASNCNWQCCKLFGSGSAEIEERSTTSSAGGGAAAYETRKAVDEYLQFHFGRDEDILPYKNGPKVR